MKIYNYKGNKIGKEEFVPVTMEEVNAQLDKLLAENTSLTEVDRPAVLGDTVTIDFEGFLDGVAFEGGKGENYDLELGSNTFIPGFEDQLVGASKYQDVEVNVTFPENYQAENLKGKATVFKCKVHAVKVKEVPVLDDEFAHQFHLDSAQQVKEVMTEQMNAQKRRKYEDDYLFKLVQEIAAKSEIEVDDDKVATRVEEMMGYYGKQMAQYGMTLEQYLQMSGMDMDAFKAQIQPQAITSLKVEVLYDEIAKAEHLELTEEELTQSVEVYANYYRVDKESLLNSEEDLKRIKDEVLKSKVDNFLFANND